MLTPLGCAAVFGFVNVLLFAGYLARRLTLLERQLDHVAAGLARRKRPDSTRQALAYLGRGGNAGGHRRRPK